MKRGNAVVSAVLVVATSLQGLVTGCGGRASARPHGDPALVDLTDPEAPLPVEEFMKPEAALIAPGDLLEIRVFNYTELSGEFLVSLDGRINLTMVGSVEAVEKTVDQLDRELTTAYSPYLRGPDLSVNVVRRAPRNVYVLGEVNSPGRYDFGPGDRVFHGVAMAGGMTAKSRESSVILLRRDRAGGDHVYRLDFGRVHDKIAPEDIYLQPGDVVFVPKSRFRTAFEVAQSLLDVLARGSTAALVLDDLLSLRSRVVTIGR